MNEWLFVCVWHTLSTLNTILNLACAQCKPIVHSIIAIVNYCLQSARAKANENLGVPNSCVSVWNIEKKIRITSDFAPSFGFGLVPNFAIFWRPTKVFSSNKISIFFQFIIMAKDRHQSAFLQSLNGNRVHDMNFSAHKHMERKKTRREGGDEQKLCLHSLILFVFIW